MKAVSVRFLKFWFWLAFLSILPILWIKSDYIQDQIKLFHYNTPAIVESLAKQTTMTPAARHIFYVNRPHLYASVADFRSNCTENEQIIVLGCYHAGENGISLYDVTDQRLNGIVQVTAAHEMLHGAYERLNNSDKKYINGLLQDYYDNDLKDQRVKDTIDLYKSNETKDILNEMHSIFGTEIKDLPEPLEAYYKRYFINRQTVVNFATAYTDEFTNINQQIDEYEAELNSLNTAINTEQASLLNQQNKLDENKQKLETYKSQKDYARYSDRVPVYDSEIE